MNPYAEAIDILTSDNFDPKHVAVTLAKLHPSIFVAIVEGRAGKIEKWKEIAIPSIKAGLKIQAIKDVREELKCGLREAKDKVEDLIDSDASLRHLYEVNRERY